MDELARTLQQAVALHQRGELERAEALYQQVLEQQPQHPDALHMLGVLNHQRGGNRQAIDLIRRALKLNPGNAGYHYNLGLIFAAENMLTDAIDAFRQTVSLDPGNASAHHNIATAMMQLGRLDNAIRSFRRAIELKPDYSESLESLGSLLIRTRRFEEALAILDQYTRLRPNDARACNHIGFINTQLGRTEEAEAFFRKAVQLDPTHAGACYNLANSLASSGRPAAALEYFRRALDLNPNFVDAHINLGNALKRTGKLKSALRHYEEAIRLKPDHVQAYNNLANTLSETGDFSGALTNFQKSLALNPDDARIHSNLLFTLAYNVMRPPAEMLAAHREWDRRHGAAGRAGAFRHARPTGPDRRLRIGYVSPDFHRHPVSGFFEPLLAAHDRAVVEVFCYAELHRPDAVTERLKKLADGWRYTIDRSDAEVARQIVDDGIDILIDLAGHTAGNRLGALTYKPAPVQATYLGYCTTTGLETMDYWITDAVLHPENTVERTTETIYRLPRCWLAYQPPTDTPPASPEWRPGTPVTFGSFNHLSKLSPAVIRRWCDILATVPDSRLLLKTKQLADTELRDELRARFADHHVDPERLLLQEASPDYLAVYNKVDIALDPYPRTGGATTADALWMGVPVITLAGERFIERQGASMLTAVGLTDLIAVDEGEYIDKAVALATDHPRRQNLRHNLRQRVADSPLCDGAGLARTLEDACLDMWRRYATAEPA